LSVKAFIRKGERVGESFISKIFDEIFSHQVIVEMVLVFAIREKFVALRHLCSGDGKIITQLGKIHSFILEIKERNRPFPVLISAR